MQTPVSAAQPAAASRLRLRSDKHLSQWARTRLQLKHDPGFLAGAALLAVLVVLAVLAPLISPYDPIEMNLADAMAPPGHSHLMGTDNFGRDILSRVLWGSRLSLGVGVVAMLIATLAGTLVGLVAGYAGGWVDSATSWFVDVLMALPGILLALALVAILGTGLFNVLLAVGIASVPGFVRLVRGSTLSAKEEAYVEAARCIGARTSRILIWHILPNVLSSVLVWASLGLAGMILTAAGLSFLGLGAQPPAPEWGVMVSNGRGFLRQAWWMAAFPGAAIVAAVLAINLVGDALRDALDPRVRSR